MMNREGIKKVRFSFEPESGKGIEVETLSRVLSAFQRAFWKIGEYSIRGEIRREKGKLPEGVAKAYTLRIVSVSKGSLDVELELPSTDLFQTPQRDLAKLVEVVESIPDKKEEIRNLLPDEKLRRKVLMDLKDMHSPRIKRLRLNGKEISADFVKSIREILAITTTQKEEELIGPIIEVKLIDNAYFGILHDGKIRKMPLTDEFLEVVIENLSKVVRVRILIKKEEETGKVEVMEVLDIESLEENSFEVEEIEYKNERFLLGEPLKIEISYEDDLWILENKTLGIIAWGERFDIAWESFREDFSYLWKEIGKEKEELLDVEAKKLKTLLCEMVIEVRKE